MNSSVRRETSWHVRPPATANPSLERSAIGRPAGPSRGDDNSPQPRGGRGPFGPVVLVAAAAESAHVRIQEEVILQLLDPTGVVAAQRRVGGARRECGPTPRPGAERQRRGPLAVMPSWYIIGIAARVASCRCLPSSNVGPHRTPRTRMQHEPPADASDLGFSFRSRKNGDLEILHHGRVAATLRGREAEDFLAEASDSRGADAQQLMARLTGNYKRGNERLAAQHHRNRS